MRAIVNANRQIFFDDTTATGANLTGVVGINCYYLRTSILNFVRQKFKQLCPSSIRDAFGKVVILDHACDIQIFNCNNAESVGKLARHLVRQIKPLVGDVTVNSGNVARGLPSPVAATLASASYTLRPRQVDTGLAKELWCLNRLAVAQSDQVGIHAQVSANSRACMRYRFRFGEFNLKGGIPFTVTPSDDNNTFDPSFRWDRAVHFDLDQADILNPQPSVLETNAIVKGIAHRAPAVAPLESGIACFLSGFDTAKESAKGFIETTQGLLDRRKVEPSSILIKLAQFFELRGLIGIINRNPAMFPSTLSLLQGGVIKLSVNLKNAVQRFGLGLIRIKAVLV